MIITNLVRYASGERSYIICFYLFSVLLLGWENRLMLVGRLMGVVVFTVFDTSDILDTSDVVAI